MGRSLCADDGALWKRGGDLEHIVKKVQEGINQVERCGTEWGFKISMENTKVMFLKNKNQGMLIREERNLKVYGNKPKKVEFFYLGVHFDPRLTWREQKGAVAKVVEQAGH